MCIRDSNGWDRYNARPGSHARRKAKREAASIAGPAPEYPSLAPLHGDWLGGCINGQTVIVRLQRDTGHRCDQWAAELDGQVLTQAAGLTRLWNLLRDRWHKAPSVRAICSRQNGYTEQDEINAACAV